MVVVTEQFLGVDRWAAAEVVASLMAEWMQQFERAALRRQALLLRDYMAGTLAWHRATAWPGCVYRAFRSRNSWRIRI
jgi:hypothetical protein